MGLDMIQTRSGLGAVEGEEEVRSLFFLFNGNDSFEEPRMISDE